jgi:tryptophanyl-tRNA synthetase
MIPFSWPSMKLTSQLGNYLGMFLPFLDLQKSAPASTSIYLSIVGLHAITLPQNPEILMESKRNMLASLLACGVDPDRTCLYFQEDVRSENWVS